MVNVASKRRLAAKVLGVGVDRIWIDPEHVDEVMDIDTREDVRILYRRGIISILPIEGQRHRVRKRKRGPGSRKGKRTALVPRKRLWMMRVRAQRRLIRRLRDSGRLSRKDYRYLYRLVKGGMFRSKAHLLDYIKSHIWSD